jgi:hypothetical protein
MFKGRVGQLYDFSMANREYQEKRYENNTSDGLHGEHKGVNRRRQRGRSWSLPRGVQIFEFGIFIRVRVLTNLTDLRLLPMTR